MKKVARSDQGDVMARGTLQGPNLFVTALTLTRL